MEAPTTSTASANTMISPKRAVMIDSVAPVTCSACRLTYLPAAVPSVSYDRQDWVCAGCQNKLG